MPAEVNYSSRLRPLWYSAAVIAAGAPLAATLLGLLPTFTAQRPFLLGYAPFLCLLGVAYAVYVRDSLTRIMFAHLLHPNWDTDVRGTRARRRLADTRRIGLALLPAAFLGGSIWCVQQYGVVLSDAVHEVMLAGAHANAGHAALRNSAGAAAGEVLGYSPAPLEDSTAVRRQLLEQTPLEEIPQFGLLTLLYVGAFLGPVLALLMMAVREYGKAALGMNERDLVLGRILEESE